MNKNDAFRIMSRETAGRFLCLLIIFAFCALTGGCATMIDEHQAAPKDWPLLTIIEREVGPIDLQRACYKYVPLSTKLLGGFAMACAEIRFDLGTCTIYRVYDTDEGVMAHEHAHCRGGQHPGDTTLSDAWRAYQQYVAGSAVSKVAR